MSQLWKNTTERSGTTVAAVCVGVAATSAGLGYIIRRWVVRRQVCKKIRKKQEQCQSAFKQLAADLKQLEKNQEEDERILGLTLLELQQGLQNGNLRAVDVLHAYQNKALVVNEDLNCITEPLLDALMVAKARDGQSGEKGLLHGVPVSVKESFKLEGMDCTMGMGQFVGDIHTEDAVLIKVMKKQGAVPFVRTNVPQTLMTYESGNPVFGETKNPHDHSRAAGGSTSGEGAILGAKASILGFGTDIGGSIRMPSHACGCYGLKTTCERLSRKGLRSLSSGQMQVSGTVGPMAQDVDGLVLAMKALLCDYHFQLDPQIPPLHFRDEMYESKRRLRIGFYTFDGLVQAVPACQRAVLLAKQALEAQGHTVVEFTPPRVKYVIPYLFIKSVQGDKGELFTSKLKDDIVDPDVYKLSLPSHLPNWCLSLISWMLRTFTKNEVLANILEARKGCGSVNAWFQHAVKLQEYKYEYLAAWREKKLDGVICPVFGTTALPHHMAIDAIVAGSYCMLYNVLNYPAGSMPVTKVTTDDVNNMNNYPDNTLFYKAIKRAAVGSEGLPVNVQCVGLPFQEERVLRLMKEVEMGLQSMQS